MNYYLLVPFFIILILILPIKMRVKISFDCLEKTGGLGIFLFGIKIQDLIFWIRGNKLVSMRNHKVHATEIEFDDSMIFVEEFSGQIKNKTRLKDLMVIYNLGAGDAFVTGMISGWINDFLVTSFSMIKSYRPTARLGMMNNIAYNKKVCTFAVNGNFSISLFDVVYSLARSVMLTKKRYSSKKKPKEAK